MAWGPFFWENFQKSDHKEIFKKISLIVTNTVLLIVIIISLFAKEVLIILTPVSYHPSAYLVGLIVLAFSFSIINQIIGVGPGITKKTIYNTANYFISVLINILTLYILIPRIGVMAAPIGLLLGAVSLFVLSWFTSEKLYYIGFSKIGLLVPFLITFLIVVSNIIYPFGLSVKLALLILIIAIMIIITLYRKRMLTWL